MKTKYPLKVYGNIEAFFISPYLDNSYDPYKAAYGSMPSHAVSNLVIQQMYINEHFCHAYKFGIITNSLGIVRDITFYLYFIKHNEEIQANREPSQSLWEVINSLFANLSISVSDKAYFILFPLGNH